MILVSAKVGPFRSMNTEQTVEIDPTVTVFVGMNEAGKTVLLKALHKSSDAVGEDEFDPIDDYPRKDLSSYLKQHKTEPATATVLTYELEESEVVAANEALKTKLPSGFRITVTHKYDNTIQLSFPVDEVPVIQAFAKTLSSDAQTAMKGAKTLRAIPDLLKEASLTAEDNAALVSLNTRLQATKWPNVSQWEVWSHVRGNVPKFLYFSDYDTLPGKMNLADLAQRAEAAKNDPKQLTAAHRSVLALLRMADISMEDLVSPGSYEELKAKIEGVSISLTDQVMEFWKQNEDLEVEVDIKADPTDAVPFNNGANL